MDTIEAIHGQRSVRSYDSRPVDRSLIENVIGRSAEPRLSRRGSRGGAAPTAAHHLELSARGDVNEP